MSVTAMQPPQRSALQREQALQWANEVRSHRRGLKASVKHDPDVAVQTLLEPTPATESMKVYDVLIAMPKVGRVKVHKMLAAAKVPPSKTLGGLTDRQRRELIGAVHALAPPFRWRR